MATSCMLSKRRSGSFSRHVRISRSRRTGAAPNPPAGSGGLYTDLLTVRTDRPYGQGEHIWPGDVTRQGMMWFATSTVAMRANNALGPDDLDEGWILTCQSLPTSTELTVDYDA